MTDTSTDYGLPYDALHVIPTRKIGKHEWRIVIVPSIYGKGVSIEYYWRREAVFGKFHYHWQHARH